MKESINSRVQNMIEHHPFDTLSPKDQQIVLGEMTQADYEMHHSIIAQTKVLGSTTIQLPKQTLSDIKKRLGDQLKPQTSITDKLSSARMPIWLALAFTFCACGLVQFLQGNNIVSEPATIPKVKIVTVTDTIIVNHIDTITKEIISDPIIIREEIIKYKEIIVEKAPPLATHAIPDSADIPADQRAYYADYETPQLLARKSGRSVSNETELMELLDLD